MLPLEISFIEFISVIYFICFSYVQFFIYIFFLLILLNTNNASCKHYLNWAPQIFTNHMLKFIRKNHILSRQMLICGQPSHNMHDDLMHALLHLRAETLQQCIYSALLSLSLALSVTELKAINPPRVSALNCWKAKPMCFSQRKLCVEWHDGLINVKDWACVEGNYSELACCFVLADADGWLKVVLTA